MYNVRRSMVIGLALVVAHISVAEAADTYFPQSGDYKNDPFPVEIVPVPSYSNMASWYLRGDISYIFYNDPEIIEGRIYNLAQENIEDTWAIGGGIGHYFTSDLRGDITFDYHFDSKVSALNTADIAVFSSGGRTHNFDLSSLVVLANLYYDFHSGGGYGDGATRSRFSPYLGVGLGFANHWASKGVVTGPVVACTCPSVTIAEGNKVGIAAAFMAGFTKTLHSNLFFDAGYQFLYLGKPVTGAVRDNHGHIVSESLAFEELSAHKIRIGLRYDIF